MKEGIYILDSETTGMSKNDQVIQLCYAQIPNSIELLKQFVCDEPSTQVHKLTKVNNYYNPSVPIHPMALEVHGLSKLKLVKHPSSTTVTVPKDMTMFNYVSA
jgi:DNA polymerase III epsilon subunit-like protein